MKLILFFVISCLALINVKGAPRTAVYKFVKCNPKGDQANCVTHQSSEMAWSPDLPAKLPAATAQYLEAEPVEDESPLGDEEEKEEEEEEESLMLKDSESPVVPKEGSGYYEGSAAGGSLMEDIVTLAEMGSGESWTEKDTKPFTEGQEDTRAMRKMFSSKYPRDEAKPAEQELKEDHLLM
ncbi:hypothetical protein PAMP_000641 [Pampus punctatissimus]